MLEKEVMVDVILLRVDDLGRGRGKPYLHIADPCAVPSAEVVWETAERHNAIGMKADSRVALGFVLVCRVRFGHSGDVLRRVEELTSDELAVRLSEERTRAVQAAEEARRVREQEAQKREAAHQEAREIDATLQQWEAGGAVRVVRRNSKSPNSGDLKRG